MDLLIGLLMNILGNDLYDRCPRFAVWIIRKALARLPENQREEYEEAWLSHLADCESKLDQVRHALGAYWSVSGIMSAEPPVRELDLDYTVVGAALMMFGSTGETILELKAGMPWSLLIFYAFQVVPSIFVLIVGLKLRKEKGKIIEM